MKKKTGSRAGLGLPEIGLFAHFSEFDLVQVLRILKEKPLGRNLLVKKLRLGEGSARSIINKLIKNKLVKSTTRGNMLTNKGFELINSIGNKITGPVKIENYNKISIAYKIKGKGNKIKLGLEQRDEAIKKGANELITLVYNNSGFIAPGIKNFEKKYKKLCDELLEKLKPSKDDVVLLCFAQDLKSANESGWAALKTLFKRNAYKSG